MLVTEGPPQWHRPIILEEATETMVKLNSRHHVIFGSRGKLNPRYGHSVRVIQSYRPDKTIYLHFYI